MSQQQKQIFHNHHNTTHPIKPISHQRFHDSQHYNYKFSHQITEGENPPYEPYVETLTMMKPSSKNNEGECIRGSSGDVRARRPSKIQNNNNFPSSTRLPPVFPSRPRLVRMDEAFERLWEPMMATTTTTATSSSEFYKRNPNGTSSSMMMYRPSMIQNEKRADVDMTATWCGELTQSHYISHSSINRTQILNELHKNENSNIDTFDCIAEDVFGPCGEMYMPRRPMMTTGFRTVINSIQNPCEGGDRSQMVATLTDHITLFEDETSDENEDEDFWASTALTSMVYTKIQNIQSMKKHQMKNKKRQFLNFSRKSQSDNENSSLKVKKSPWTRCIERLKIIKRAVLKKESKSKLVHVPSVKKTQEEDNLGSSHSMRKLCKCLGGGFNTTLSQKGSLELSFEQRREKSAISIPSSPFLTTSALFDCPGSPMTHDGSPMDSMLDGMTHDFENNTFDEYMMQRSEMVRGKSSGSLEDYNGSRDMNAVYKTTPALSELWDESDIDSHVGSGNNSDIMHTGPCWIPPILKSDTEYQKYQSQMCQRALKMKSNPENSKYQPSQSNRHSDNDFAFVQDMYSTCDTQSFLSVNNKMIGGNEIVHCEIEEMSDSENSSQRRRENKMPLNSSFRPGKSFRAILNTAGSKD